MKPIIAFLLRHRWSRLLLGWLVHKYILFVFDTNHWKKIGLEHIETIKNTRKPAIFAIWHGRIMLGPAFDPMPNDSYVMVSQHGDGAFLSPILRYFNFQTIHGSTNRSAADKKGAKNRGGATALRQAIRTLKKGHNIVITPDGPSGPNQKVNSSIIELAQISGIPIVPVSSATSRSKHLRSWDRFLLSFPFGKGALIYGKPIYVPRDLSKDLLEKTSQELENQLDLLTIQADKTVGVLTEESTNNN